MTPDDARSLGRWCGFALMLVGALTVAAGVAGVVVGFAVRVARLAGGF